MSSLVSKSSKNSHQTEYFFSDETGDARIQVYHLYPGVEAAYVSVHMDQFDFGEIERELGNRYVGFHYCREGRIEQEADNEFFYLMPGDCSIIIQDKQHKQFYLPMRHYHGISIGIDTNTAPDCFAEGLLEEGLVPVKVAKNICGEHHAAILRACEPVKRIFTDLFEVKEEQRANYLKIKLLELLFLLKYTDHSAFNPEDIHVSRTQAELVKEVARYIGANMNGKIALKDITAKFSVSASYLQNSFRAVYGMPVISFIRMQKMQSAAQVLIHTRRSIDDIADEFGYINESKFSAVFKKIMGDSPSVYRKEHSKIKIW